MKKSNKYGTTSFVHLLLYTTDFRFRLNETVLFLIAYWFFKNKHSFKTILYFLLQDERYGDAKILFPLPQTDFANFDEQAAKNRKVIIGDPTRIKIVDENTFEIPLNPLFKE